MGKNIINHIFIYILLIICIGCESNIVGVTGSCSDCVLEVSVPDLDVDSNGFYHLEFDENYIQTFVKLEAYVGIGYAHLGWESDTENCVQMWNYMDCNDVVNPASYSDSDGYAYQMMGVYEGNIGQTATIWVGYYDNYGTQWLDSIKVKINE